MPFQVRERCADCRQISDMPITFAAEYNRRAVVSESHLIKAARANRPIEGDDASLYGTALCALCGTPKLVRFSTNRRFKDSVIGAIGSRESLMGGQSMIDVEAIFPAAPKYDDHASWPEKVRGLLGSAQKMEEDRDILPTITIATCRSALDVATVELGATKGKLVHRINELRDRAVITQALADWAHAVRLDGNDAVHEAEGSRADAKELLAFVRLFLQVTFTLPAEIEAKKGRGAAQA